MRRAGLSLGATWHRADRERPSRHRRKVDTTPRVAVERVCSAARRSTVLVRVYERFNPGDLYAADPHRREFALRCICPCHGSWELFERHLDDVKRLEKDPDPAVRAAALHLWEDVGKLESIEFRDFRAEERAVSRNRRRRPRDSARRVGGRL
jgi:hypothetical protein